MRQWLVWCLRDKLGDDALLPPRPPGHYPQSVPHLRYRRQSNLEPLREAAAAPNLRLGVPNAAVSSSSYGRSRSADHDPTGNDVTASSRDQQRLLVRQKAINDDRSPSPRRPSEPTASRDSAGVRRQPSSSSGRRLRRSFAVAVEEAVMTSSSSIGGVGGRTDLLSPATADVYRTGLTPAQLQRQSGGRLTVSSQQNSSSYSGGSSFESYGSTG